MFEVAKCLIRIYNCILSEENSLVFSATFILTVGMWLSLVERTVRDREVAGSNPVIPTILLPKTGYCISAMGFHQGIWDNLFLLRGVFK